MTVLQLYEWCLYPRRGGVCGEAAIREAVARGSAVVSIGPHRFEYRDAVFADGRHVLQLSPLTQREPELLSGLSAEKLVPAPLGHWGDEDRARLVLAIGYALFKDVEEMVCRGSCTGDASVRREHRHQ